MILLQPKESAPMCVLVTDHRESVLMTALQMSANEVIFYYIVSLSILPILFILLEQLTKLRKVQDLTQHEASQGSRLFASAVLPRGSDGASGHSRTFSNEQCREQVW